MKYLIAGTGGALAGAIAGAVLGIPLMLWGPGANDPLAILWLFFGALVTAPAGIVVALALVWGTPKQRFVAGTYVKPAVLGALVGSGTAFAILREEALDEWFNLPVFALMGAGTGVLTSFLFRPRALPPPRRRSARAVPEQPRDEAK